MISEKNPDFVVLAIIDGWGIAPPGDGNAISLANTPNMKKFWVSYPHTQLSASGKAVGLPQNEEGNTETGHLNLGAGRIVYQDLERINMSIADGSFFENKEIIKAFKHVKKHNSKLHIIGLLGAGGTHSNLDHLFALLRFSAIQKTKDVYLHLFTDGRDSPPTAAKTYINSVYKVIKKEGLGTIASIMGRYWAMDRDQRWERTEKAYRCLTKGEGIKSASAEAAVDLSYEKGKTDEFIEPTVIVEGDRPVALIEKNDAVIFFNFRIDRPRQLSKAFILSDFSKAPISFDFDPFEVRYEKTHISKEISQQGEPFKRGDNIENLLFVTMTKYSNILEKEGAITAFPPDLVETPLSSVISSSQKRQLKITESEKERFVTFYFNGLREKPFSGEDVVIIPSPKVHTYDKKPEMSIEKLTSKILEKISLKNYSLIVANLPNPDMVGHTGNIGPAIKAIEVVDSSLGKLSNLILAENGALVITADHGNVEEMINLKTGEVDTEHSTNPVPFIVVCNKYLGKSTTLPSGILADVAPTILSILGLSVPTQMTGRNLLQYLHI